MGSIGQFTQIDGVMAYIAFLNAIQNFRLDGGMQALVFFKVLQADFNNVCVTIHNGLWVVGC